MTTLTPAQIAQVAANAGFTGTGLVRAVACALAESGGNPAAVNVNRDGSKDRGLWQFNSKYHPEVSDTAAFTPATAAAAAYTVSKGGTNWNAWATWSNGGMAAQMGRAQLAAAGVTSSGTNASQAIFGIPGTPSFGDIENGLGSLTGGITDGISSALDLTGLTQIGKAVVKTAVWMANPHNWLRVLEVAAGAGVVVLGVKLLADSGVGGPVGAVARGAAQAPGKVTKAAVKVAAAVATDGASVGASAASKGMSAASKTAGAASKTAAAAKGAAKTAAKGATA